METIMEKNHDFYVKEGHYASKGTANTALGLGIAGTALGLLNGGLNIFNKNGSNTQEDLKTLEKKQCQDYLNTTKEYYEGKLQSLRELTDSVYALDTKIKDNAVTANLETRQTFDALNSRIIDLEKAMAVQAAVSPYIQQINDMKINGVMGAVNLEAERRCCADGKIVNYVNSTFYPKMVADITAASTTTTQPTYNPLAPVCGCNMC